MTSAVTVSLENVIREQATQVSWSSDLVDFEQGDIWVDGAGFGTYFFVTYPQG
jgi:hypothetical protein